MEITINKNPPPRGRAVPRELGTQTRAELRAGAKRDKKEKEISQFGATRRSSRSPLFPAASRANGGKEINNLGEISRVKQNE